MNSNQANKITEDEIVKYHRLFGEEELRNIELLLKAWELFQNYPPSVAGEFQQNIMSRLLELTRQKPIQDEKIYGVIFKKNDGSFYVTNIDEKITEHLKNTIGELGIS